MVSTRNPLAIAENSALALVLGLWLTLVGFGGTIASAQITNSALPSFDFTNPTDSQGWLAAHDISSLQTTSTGLVAQISGSDPFFIGPQRDYPTATPLWARLRLFSDEAGTGQLFYFDTTATEANSVRFAVAAQHWVTVRVSLPTLGANYRIRLDPPGISGKAVYASLVFEARSAFPEFDFRTLPDAASWNPDHDIASLTPAAEGLRIQIAGRDPYMSGPPRDYPADRLLWLHLRLKSETGGSAQVFYFADHPTEAASVKFFVPPGDWQEVRVPMPSLGAGWHLRFDPPGDNGVCVVERLWFTERTLLQPPLWPVPTPPAIGQDSLTVQSGDLVVSHDRHRLGAFELKAAGQVMAVGHTTPMLGYLVGNAARWLPLTHSETNPATVSRAGEGLRVAAEFQDPDGGSWLLEQIFAPTHNNAIHVESRFSVNQDRSVVYFPMFTLLAGLGTFGTNKTQGLFCGLEYLENEASSSEADVTGPESKRQVPDMVKVTFPLMVVAAQERYVGLLWDSCPDICAMFDSPDRLYGSGSHIMGLLFPGSRGQDRQEGNLLPYGPVLVRSNQAVIVRATLLGGIGASVVPAVQQYVSLRPLPPMPTWVQSFDDYINLTARGWLDSQIHSNSWFRHAYWPGFNLQPASDAPVWLRWLAERTTDATLRTRLLMTANAAIQQVPGVHHYNDYQIAHVTYPLPSLIYNQALTNTFTAQANAQALLSRFQPDGTVLYQPSPGGVDYGRTHYAPDANGLTATYLQSLLENVVFAGDSRLIETALTYLRTMNKFRNTVPRGAQTWEVPLHTPDILASAKLLRCYTLGYELTGNLDFLEQARYWAWTGVPFVYLTPPAEGAVGTYATIPVFGATTWTGSWFGVPVQWCGLVYADALNRFHRHDPSGPWRQIADGIAASGIQQSFPLSDSERLGLLPDFFLLRAQVSAGPAINPGTLQPVALRFYDQTAPFEFYSFREHGLRLFAPGALSEISEHAGGVSFTVMNWSSNPVSLLVNGFTNQPQVRLNGQNITLATPHQYQSAGGHLVLRVQGTVRVELIYPVRPKLRIKPSATSGSVDLSWPILGSNFVLEYSPNPIFSNLWAPSLQERTLQDQNVIVTEPASTSARFFRLRWNP